MLIGFGAVFGVRSSLYGMMGASLLAFGYVSMTGFNDSLTFLEIIQPAVLALALVQLGYLAGALLGYRAAQKAHVAPEGGFRRLRRAD